MRLLTIAFIGLSCLCFLLIGSANAVERSPSFTYKGFVGGFLSFNSNEAMPSDTLKSGASHFRANGNIHFNLSKKARLNLNFQQKTTQDYQAKTHMVFSDVRLQLDYEFIQNLFYQAFVNYSSYNHHNFTKDSEGLGAGTGLHYRLNPKLSLSSDYQFQTKENTAFGRQDNAHEIYFRLNKKF